MNTSNDQNKDLVFELLGAFGRAIGIASVYGGNHALSLNAFTETYELTTNYLKHHETFHLGVQKGTLLANGTPIKEKSNQLQALIDALTHLEIYNLRLDKEISKKEFLFLLQSLAKSRHAKSSSTLSDDVDHPHITQEKGTFRLIRDGEDVVNTSTLSEENRTGSNNNSEQNNSLQLNNLIAFIHGSGIELPQSEMEEKGKAIAIKEEVVKLAKTPEKMAKILLESISIRQKVSSVEGESLNDIVVGCLRRTYNLLRTQPGYKKKKSVTSIRKSLLILEEELLEKLHGKENDSNQEDPILLDAIHQLDSQLQVEEKIWRCAETQKSYLRAQKELNKVIKNSDAKAPLLRDGVPLSIEKSESKKWMQMVLQENTVLSEGQPNSNQLEHIASTFDKLKTLVEQLSEHPEKIAPHKKKKKLSYTIDGKSQEMTRLELLRVLSEITQELMQPVTSIMISLEMLIRGFAGVLLPEQHELLSLAEGRGDHLTHLLNQLLNIVGVPINKGIDAQFKEPS